MKKIALCTALIGFVCFLTTSASAQTSATATKADKKVVTRTSITPSIVKTLPADSIIKVVPAVKATDGSTNTTSTDKTAPAPTSTKCPSMTTGTPCQKKCAAGGNTKCTMPCGDKKVETKTVVPKN